MVEEEKNLISVQESKCHEKSRTDQEQTMEMEMEKRWMPTMTTTTTTYIPNDIMVRILPLLPLNSLLRFRWTCKCWFDLITRDTSIGKMQLHNSLFSRYPSVLISSLRAGYKEILQCHLTETKGYLSSPVKINDPFESPIGFQLLGSCHGLLFFFSTDHLSFCIWNPCTKEYKLLPTPKQPISGNQHGRHVYGFGYDSSIDDYKVIRNSYFYERTFVRSPVLIGSSVQVYRLGTDTWTSIGANRYNLLPYNYKKCGVVVYNYTKDSLAAKDYDWGDPVYNYGEGGVYANGALYWIDSLKKQIISFDIAKETYQELSKQPECFHGNLKHLQGMKLQLFQGSLCLVLNILDSTMDQYFVEMWVMKDYGMNNDSKDQPSWTMLFKVMEPYNESLVIKPLRFTNHGELLSLKNGRDLVLCNPKKNDITTLNSTLRKGAGSLVEAVYNESFVSLNSGTYVGREEKEKIKRRNN